MRALLAPLYDNIPERQVQRCCLETYSKYFVGFVFSIH